VVGRTSIPRNLVPLILRSSVLKQVAEKDPSGNWLTLGSPGKTAVVAAAAAAAAAVEYLF